MTSNSSQQRKVLRDFKYPDIEGRVQATYYREARDWIVAFHSNEHDDNWLIDRARELSRLAELSTGQTTSRLNHNAKALQEYCRHFGLRKFEILNELKLDLKFENVRVTVRPDLHVREKGKEKIIKLEFSRTAPTPTMVKIISQSLYEATIQAPMSLPSSQIIYLDVPRGHSHKGARVGARMRSEIEAACKNIEAIWDGI